MRLNRHTLTVIRERTLMSKAQLAERAGIDRTLVTRIENGERTATDRVIMALAEALDVTPLALGDDERAA